GINAEISVKEAAEEKEVDKASKMRQAAENEAAEKEAAENVTPSIWVAAEYGFEGGTSQIISTRYIQNDH
ncbi:hypothetical protein Tco_1573876, partial [Tanacetum coccineum]